jgi:hypothetical protein
MNQPLHLFTVKTYLKAVVLKLGIATLLRVANCQKRVALFDSKKKIDLHCRKHGKNQVLRLLECREIFQTSLGVANQKSLRTPALRCNQTVYNQRQVPRIRNTL